MAATTVLETLIVRLKADTIQFQKGLKQAKGELKKSVSFFTQQAKVAQAQVKETMQEGKRVTESVRTSTERYGLELKKLNALFRQGAISSQTHRRAVNKLGAEFDTAGKKMKALGSRISDVGRTMTIFVTGPLTLVGTLSVRAFAAFDQAMTESMAIMGDLSEQTQMRMENVAKAISAVSITAPKELAESFFFLASAGLTAEQSINALAVVEKFAVAGAFDMATATDLLTDAQTALGVAFKDPTKNMEAMVRLSDVLVKANTLANASVRQFSEALTNRAAASLKIVNKDVEEGVAVLAAFADQGLKGASAGQALAIVMRDLQSKAIENSQAFEKAKVSVFDSSGAMANLGDIVADLEKRLEGQNDEMKKTILLNLGFADRSVIFIQTLIGQSAAIKEYEKELRKAGGTTKDVADKQLQSFSNQMKIVKNNVNLAAIEIGGILAPAVSAVGLLVKGASLAFRGLNGAIKVVIVAAGALIAVIGPLIFLVGKLIVVWGFMISSAFKSVLAFSVATIATKAYTIATVAATIATKAFVASMFFVAGVLGSIVTVSFLVSAALVAVAVSLAAVATIGIVKLLRTWEDVNEAVEKNADLNKDLLALRDAQNEKELNSIKLIEKFSDRMEKLKERQIEVNEKVTFWRKDLELAGEIMAKNNTIIGRHLSLSTDANIQAEQASGFQKSALKDLEKVTAEIERQNKLRRTAGGRAELRAERGEERRAQIPTEEIDAVRAKIDQLSKSFQFQRQTIGMTDDEIEIFKATLDSTGKVMKGFEGDVADATKAFAKLREAQALKEAEKDFAEFTKSLQFQIDVLGETVDETILLDFANRGLNESVLAGARALQKKIAAGKEDIKAEKDLAASKEAAIKSADSLIASLEQEIAVLNGVGLAAELAARKNEGATDKQIKSIEMLRAAIAAIRKETQEENRLKDEAIALTKRLRTAQEEFNDTIENLKKLKPNLTQETLIRAVEEAQKKLKDAKKEMEKPITITFETGGIEAFDPQTEIRAFNAFRRRQQVETERVRRTIAPVEGRVPRLPFAERQAKEFGRLRGGLSFAEARAKEFGRLKTGRVIEEGVEKAKAIQPPRLAGVDPFVQQIIAARNKKLGIGRKDMEVSTKPVSKEEEKQDLMLEVLKEIAVNTDKIPEKAITSTVLEVAGL